MLQAIPLFPTPVWHYRISDWETKKEQLLSLHEDKPEYWEDDNFTDFRRDNLNSYSKEFSTIMIRELMEFQDCVKQSFVGINGLSINSVWTQKYLKNKFMGPHTHGSQGFSSVIYTEFTKGEHKSTCLQAYNCCPVTGDHQEIELDVEEGDMIIFPSTMAHYANPSESDNQRTIVSFNMTINWNV